tara:strand:- start:432 stop:848 length:417 start_codon:yes stop_codon:yes gene_type:complete
MVFKYGAGLGAVGSYLVSGKPFVSGNIDPGAAGNPYRVQFPSVTRWIMVRNIDPDTNADLACAFSENGLDSKGGTNYFTLQDANASLIDQAERLELKVTEMWFEGMSAGCRSFDIIAGLTGIPTTEIIDNWSGSAGVG